MFSAPLDIELLVAGRRDKMDYGITPYADVIVVKVRYYNGKYQYRRWNETRGYWVDPEWIDM